MLILVSNDDGIDSAGLKALAQAVDHLGEVWVVAPDREQSASSNSISLDRPLRGNEVRSRWVAVNGTPTDCVYLAINHVLPRGPDLVLSGINRGPNLGDDVHYSGTVAAAMEGALCGVPSMAISHAGTPPFQFEAAAAIARHLVERMLEAELPGQTLLNVNVPGGAGPDAPIAVTRLGKRRYANAVERRLDPRGRPYFWIGGEAIAFENTPESDCNAVEAGLVSVTPIRLDMTDFGALGRLQDWSRS